jgi:hypothetical protein
VKRATLNRLIDTLAFGSFVLVAATGCVLYFLLPPGSGRLQGTGSGWRALEQPVTLLWGLTRHTWGTVHFWMALGLMLVLALHLVLHWRWIVCTIRGQPRQGSGSRVALGVVGLAAVLVLVAAPLLTPTAHVPRSQLTGQTAPAPPEPPQGQEQQRETRGQGALTLQELAYITGMSVPAVAEQLGLPPDVSPEAPLSRLRRRYGVKLVQIRAVVTASRP